MAEVIRVAVPSDDERTVAPHFGRTVGFLVFEVEGEAVRPIEYRRNTFTAHTGVSGLHHGLGKHERILAGLGDVSVVIAGGMGQGMVADFAKRGTRVLLTSARDAAEAVAAFARGELLNEAGRCCEGHSEHHHDPAH